MLVSYPLEVPTRVPRRKKTTAPRSSVPRATATFPFQHGGTHLLVANGGVSPSQCASAAAGDCSPSPSVSPGTQPVHDPLMARFTASFCLPIVGFRNDDRGRALRYLAMPTIIGYSNPYIRTRPRSEADEICEAMVAFRQRNTVTVLKNEEIDDFRGDIEYHLTNWLPDMLGRRVELAIYGSSRNGFGTKDCDVDMSLTFHPCPPQWAVSSDVVMRAVAKALVDHPRTLGETYIAAKVPIVRFRGVQTTIEADISYDNKLALHNTSLLSHYCMWDYKRLPTVGVWIKTWAKRCGIADASKGGLSSYAWVLLLIYYMQNNGSPRFLRILQHEHRPLQVGPQDIVKGCDVSFWKFYDPYESGNNDTTPYELFVGFLDFYINFFQVHRYNERTVIQIRQPAPLYRHQVNSKCNGWMKSILCIQDPFDLDHNLAQGVDEHMLQYMVDCLHKSRQVFLDRNRRATFLASRGMAEDQHLDPAWFSAYSDFLLHSCTLDREPPLRHFYRPEKERDRTVSQCTDATTYSGHSLDRSR